MNLIQLQQNELSKDAINNASDHVKNLIYEGHIDPLKAHLYFKAVSKIAKDIVDNTLNEAITEADKYGADNKLHGTEFNIRSTPSTIDYEQDEEYKSLKDALKDREQKLKDAWKAKEKDQNIVDDNGEQVPVLPLKSNGSQTISVSFK